MKKKKGICYSHGAKRPCVHVLALMIIGGLWVKCVEYGV